MGLSHTNIYTKTSTFIYNIYIERERRTYAYVYNICIYTHMCVYIHTCPYIYIYTYILYIYIYRYIDTCIEINMMYHKTCVSVCVYIYIHTSIHSGRALPA